MYQTIKRAFVSFFCGLFDKETELKTKFFFVHDVEIGKYRVVSWLSWVRGNFFQCHIKKFLKPAMFGLLADSLAMFGLLADSFSFVYGGVRRAWTEAYHLRGKELGFY